MFHVAALVFTVAGTVRNGVLLLLGVLCVRTVFSFPLPKRCFSLLKRGKKLVFWVAGLAGCISKGAGRFNFMAVKVKDSPSGNR